MQSNLNKYFKTEIIEEKEENRTEINFYVQLNKLSKKGNIIDGIVFNPLPINDLDAKNITEIIKEHKDYFTPAGSWAQRFVLSKEERRNGIIYNSIKYDVTEQVTAYISGGC